MLRENKSDYEIFIIDAEMMYLKALQCEDAKEFEKAKNYYHQASKIYLEASKIAPSNKYKNIALAYHKQCEKCFHNAIKEMLKQNLIVNKSKEK